MDQKYTAYFEGKLRKGYDKTYASMALSRNMKLSDGKIASLFSKDKVKIKSNLNQDDALYLAKKFYHCGLKLRLTRTDVKGKLGASADIKQQNFQEIFAGQCPKVNLSWGYRIGLCCNVLLTLALPIIYLSLIGAVIYGLYWYVSAILPEARTAATSIYYQLFIWLAPPLIGIVLLIFLCKPLFASYRERPQTLLKRSENPEFFQLVDALANFVGCQKPALVYINNDANASASFYQGLKGVFNGKMVLTLGMPLVAGMTTQQLAGVIAHEFGHFAQRGAMRASFLINSINAWLYSRAYEEDSLDEKIDEMLAEAELGVWVLMLGLASFCIGLVRLLMHLLLTISLRASFYLSRKMEFDADSYEVAVAGSSAFKGTSLQLRLLNMAQHAAEQVNDEAYEHSSSLLEDMPSAIADIAQRFDQKTIDEIEASMAQVQTQVWDTHPADNERIQYAEALDKTGCYLSQVPAAALFENFEELNKKVTCHYYDKYLYILDPKECMVPNNKVFN